MPEHEIYRYRSHSSRLAHSGGELKSKETDDSFGIAVRALEDGRIGFGYCQREADVAKTLERALKASRSARKSGFGFAPAAQAPALEISDPHIDPEDYKGMKALVDEAREAAESLGGKSRIILSFSQDRIGLQNSAGFEGSYQKTVFSLYAECMSGDGFGSAYLTSTSLPKDTESVGKDAAEMAKAMQGAGKPGDGLYTVVMEIEALENIIETILPSFSGDWKRRGMTRLSEGARMFSDKLTMVENPLDGVAARPFDDEGTPSAPKTIVEAGAVKGFLYDRETAALSETEGWGSCSRASYDSMPAISSSNIVISPGDREDLGDLDRYIELRSAHGAHTANITSGDIGLEASSAFLVEKGQRKPVKGFMLTGNAFEMLSRIEGMEKRQRVYGSLISPRIAFSNVQVVT